MNAKKYAKILKAARAISTLVADSSLGHDEAVIALQFCVDARRFAAGYLDQEPDFGTTWRLIGESLAWKEEEAFVPTGKESL